MIFSLSHISAIIIIIISIIISKTSSNVCMVVARLFFLALVVLTLTTSAATAGVSSISSNSNNSSMEETATEVASSSSSSSSGLRWVNLSVSSGNKYLLHPSHGFIPNGYLCGVIGPSGAGKSTLLAALGGHTPDTPHLHLTGSVWFHSSTSAPSYYLSTSDGEVAMLQQNDAFFSMLTPRETIDLAALLQLHLHTDAERSAIVNRILESLGLKADQHRTIGDRSIGAASGGTTAAAAATTVPFSLPFAPASSSVVPKDSGGGGLSGGERRRLSVGLELVTAPKVLLADEATTGLDSTQAEKVVTLIKQLSTERNIPSICTLHQPRASIWRKLDMVILLAPGGKCCYIGNRTEVMEYFATLGYPCPTETNPAEFLIDLVSIDYEDPEQAQKDLERIDYLASSFKKNHPIPPNDPSWVPPSSSKAILLKRVIGGDDGNGGNLLFPRRKKGVLLHFLKRFRALLERSWRQNIRDSKLNLFRLFASIGQAFFFAQKYRSVRKGFPPTAKSIADRTALLSFGVINMSMLAIMKSLELFGREKTIVTRERMRRQYSGFEYLLSKVLAEFPLDAAFASAFAAILKWKTGLVCSLQTLCATYSLMTIAGASLGFAVGSFTSNVETARVVGFPLMVLFMVVGIINPSGVSDADDPEPSFISIIKMASPIRWAIEALCIAEYTGMEFAPDSKRKGWFGRVINVFENPRMGALALVQNGAQILDAIGLKGGSYESHMKNLAILTGINLLISLFGLEFCGPKFKQAMNQNDNTAADRALDLEEEDAEFSEDVPLSEKQRDIVMKTSGNNLREPTKGILNFRGNL